MHPLMQAFQSKSHSKIPAGVAGEGNRVSEVQLQLQGTDLKPNMFSANASEVARPLPEGVSSILRQPEVA